MKNKPTQQELFNHQGTAKQALLLSLDSYIYRAANHKLTKTLDTIIKHNSLITGSNCMAFNYKGELYWTITNRVYGKAPYLDKSLYDSTDKYINESLEISNEVTMVNGFFTKILLMAKTKEDVVALLPECLRSVLGSHINSSKTFSNEYVQEFLTSHEQSVQLIKERLVLNMVT